MRFLIKGLTESQIKLFFNKYPFFCLFFALFDQNSEIILQMAILGEKQKNFFFWKLYQNANNTWPFDFWSKDLLSHKLSFFLTNTPFFVLFFWIFFTAEFSHFLMTYFFLFPFLTKNSETILQMAILGEKQKNFVFLKTLSKC